MSEKEAIFVKLLRSAHLISQKAERERKEGFGEGEQRGESFFSEEKRGIKSLISQKP